LTPLRWATSTRRLEFELFGEPHHQDQIHVFGHLLDRFLAVLRGVTNVVAGRTLDEGEFLAQPGNDFLRVVKA